ncbi:hypothetical protein Busp01_02450 [Trinickia caryophylli]|nr:hypothetical protein Busp01_02450 [Trinickia caryophylli]
MADRRFEQQGGTPFAEDPVAKLGHLEDRGNGLADAAQLSGSLEAADEITQVFVFHEVGVRAAAWAARFGRAKSAVRQRPDGSGLYRGGAESLFRNRFANAPETRVGRSFRPFRGVL